MSLSATTPTAVYDVIGLGFGPANVAIAGALVEKWAAPGSHSYHAPQQVLFIEKQGEFRWHPGMLLPNSRMQISFLKDLATLRSPQSPITFLAYLHSQNRLLAFINRGSFTPTRQEYADYLSWAAEYVQKQGIHVHYGEEVVAIDHCHDGLVEVRSRHTDSGEEFSRKAKSLIISPGGAPRLPPALASHWPSSRVFHSSSYISSSDAFFASAARNSAPLRIAVIGAGQSATEVLLDIHTRLNALPVAGGQKHALEMIFRKGSLKPSDDTPFSNEIFDPASTDFLFGLPTQRDRQTVLREYNNTNYSVVNPTAIDSLYEVLYHQKLLDGVHARTGREDGSDRTRITLRPYTSIFAADLVPASPETSSSKGETVRLTLHNILTRAVDHTSYDAVFCGTGYDRDSWMRLLASSNLAEHFGIKSSNIVLVPETEPARPTLQLLAAFDDMESSPVSSPTETDAFSTPPTTPDTPHSHHVRLSAETARSEVRISRTYRLLSEKESKGELREVGNPRVYLQGCTQSTHGLSESLLSIMGVRAGLVVDELCSSE